MGKNFARTDYATNHLDKEAIVYPSVDGTIQQLTREQFRTEAEFMF